MRGWEDGKMRDVTFGQYYPAESPVHRCDPRTKILFFIVYIAAIFTAKNFYGLGACAFVFLLVAALSRVPFGSLLRSVRAIVFLLVFTAVLNLFFYPGETVWWQWELWKFIKITREGTIYTVFLAVRLFLLRFDAPVQSQHQRTERKLKQKITEKEQAHGLKSG